jgi:hypothetical protein
MLLLSVEHLHWFELGMGALNHSRVTTVQHRVESQGISTTAKFKIQLSRS